MAKFCHVSCLANLISSSKADFLLQKSVLLSEPRLRFIPLTFCLTTHSVSIVASLLPFRFTFPFQEIAFAFFFLAVPHFQILLTLLHSFFVPHVLTLFTHFRFI